MKNFAKCAAIRALRTFAQTAVATIGTTAVLSEVDWLTVASASALAALLCVLTSIATGLPEAGYPEDSPVGPAGSTATAQIEDLKRGAEANRGDEIDRKAD